MEQSQKPGEGEIEPVSYERWRELVEQGLKGAPFDKKLVTGTVEGIAVEPLYTAADREGKPADGYPGLAPFRRGAAVVGHADGDWCARQGVEAAELDRARQDLAGELARGTRSLWLRMDRAVRLGGPPEAGSADGVVALTAAQLGELLSPLSGAEVQLTVDAGGNALAAVALLEASGAGEGRTLELGADPLGALARDGALPCSLERAREQLVALCRHCAASDGRLTAATVSTLPHHLAGAHAGQELAFALATGVSYLRWLADGDVAPATAASQITFTVAVGSDFFMEIAKLRALRQCWHRVLAACGVEQPAGARLHAVTSGRTKTARDPWVNLLRETTEAFAAAVAGADAITTAGFDRRLGDSDAFARRIAANTQVILNEESHVTQVADAGGGSWYLESLTDQLATRGWATFQELERAGGMERALLDGKVAALIAEAAGERGKRIARRKQAITGVSEFANVAEAPVERPAADAAAIARQAEAAAAAPPSSAALTALEGAGSDALVAAAVQAARAGHGVAQLTRALAGGTQPAKVEPLPVRHDADAYERLRDACDAAERASGKRPAVFLCNLGPIPEHKARASFATGFFNAGGLSVVDNDGFADTAACVAAFRDSGARSAVLCGPDTAYPEWVPDLVPALREAGAVEVLLAGRGGDHEQTFRDAGISTFIYMGADVVATLEGLLERLGVK